MVCLLFREGKGKGIEVGKERVRIIMAGHDGDFEGFQKI